MTEMERHETRYFWSGWFDGQSFATLAAVFAVFSFVDLLATLRTMAPGTVTEGNPLANTALGSYGYLGFVAYKFVLVSLIIGVLWIIYRSKPRLAQYVLWGAILLMAFIAILHLAILSTMIIFV